MSPISASSHESLSARCRIAALRSEVCAAAESLDGEKQRGEKQELKPEMRDLILRFDAKDRRDEDARQRREKSKPWRQRVEKSATP
jgi:hypothetical protein